MAEEVASSVVGKVVDLLFGVAKKEISYMWNYTQNVEKFKKVLRDLKDMKARVQQQIDLANSIGDKLLVGVERWVDKANDEISEAEVFLKQEENVKKTGFKLLLGGNWVTLYRYSKMATKKASSLVEHQEGGKIFESGVSVYTPAPGPLDVYQNKNLDDINTHKLILEKVIAAIEDESVQIIGIYGLGGVGKTTLAMEVVARVKNQFATIAFTTVSQTVDADKIHKDIGDATKRIMKGEKVLIILDDVWEELEFEKLGIPCGINHMNCKILLTSRSDDVCDKMNVQCKICVNSLPIEEAWIIFKGVVGEIVEKDVKLKEIAIEVVKECGGLPLIIQVVAKALKNKTIKLWETALTQLQKHAPSNIAPGIRKAYTHLKLSYDYLESEEVKSCFLLCSVFPEDHDIFFEQLVCYGVALGKFEDADSISDARERVRNAVNILKSCGLLLNGNRDEFSPLTFITDENYFIKMHDVVRDVALLIASEGNNKYLVEAGKDLTEWLPRNNTLESYSGISLMNNYISKIPDYQLHVPRLNTFLIQNNNLSMISNEFIGGMKQARVLDMNSNRISSLPQSLKLLTKLRMLDLGGNISLHEISILGELKELEILILTNSGIKEIPQEIGELVNLRRLEVDGCNRLSHISPGVLLALCWLEELSIGFYSMTKNKIHDSLVEVTKLSKLTHLNLWVPLDIIPEGFVSEKFKGITIHDNSERYFHSLKIIWFSKYYLVLNQTYLKIPFLKWIRKFIEVSPDIYLIDIFNLSNILPSLYHEGFNKLESIWLRNCRNVSCLVDTTDKDSDELEWPSFNLSKDYLGDEWKTKEKFFTQLKHLRLEGLMSLKVLWNCPDQYMSLSNLVTIHIFGCWSLVRLFPVSVAQGLVNLQRLSIIDGGLEEVIWCGDDEQTDDTEIVARSTNIIVFPCLAKIYFRGLNRLRSFCSGNLTIKYPSLEEVNIRDCCDMKKWGDGIQDTPKLKFVDDVRLDGRYGINDAVVKSSQRWKQIKDRILEDIDTTMEAARRAMMEKFDSEFGKFETIDFSWM